MIRTLRDLKFYLAADKFALGKTSRYPRIINDEVWRYQILLRKAEFYKNNDNTVKNKILKRVYQFRERKLALQLGFDIPYNVIGPGLRINHYGHITINAHSKIGMWCDIHQGVNVGANNATDNQILVPKVGSNVWIGPGAKLFGDILIDAKAVIGANAVVNKSVPKNTTVAGAPAKIVKKTGTDGVDVAASEKNMHAFFRSNPQYLEYAPESYSE